MQPGAFLMGSFALAVNVFTAGRAADTGGIQHLPDAITREPIRRREHLGSAGNDTSNALFS